MAYIIGAVGGSLPLPAGVGSIAGMVGMLILYGVRHSAALAAVILYQAVGELVPLAGGGIAYVLLRRDRIRHDAFPGVGPDAPRPDRGPGGGEPAARAVAGAAQARGSTAC